MSPRHPDGQGDDDGFPRMSGDEPFIAVAQAMGLSFSPHERG